MMVTAVKSKSFERDHMMQLNKFESREAPVDPVFEINKPFKVLLPYFMPIYLSLERLGVVGDPTKTFYKMTSVFNDDDTKPKLEEVFKKLSASKSFTDDDLMEVRVWIG